MFVANSIQARHNGISRSLTSYRKTIRRREAAYLLALPRWQGVNAKIFGVPDFSVGFDMVFPVWKRAGLSLPKLVGLSEIYRTFVLLHCPPSNFMCGFRQGQRQ
jgi:hypothetical protein